MQVPVGHEEGVLVGDVGREGRRQSVNVAFDGDQFVAEASSGGQSEEGLATRRMENFMMDGVASWGC